MKNPTRFTKADRDAVDHVARGDGAEFLLGPTKRSKAEIAEVDRWMEEASRGIAHLGADVAQIAKVAGALVFDSGLTMRGICVLLQDRLGKGPGGKPKYSIETLEDVLTTLTELSEFVRVKR